MTVPRRAIRIPVLCCLALAGHCGSALAQDRVPEAPSPGSVKRGGLALIGAPKGMRYFLQVPGSYRPDRGARLIVFLHGSNMNGLTYLRSFNAGKWATDDIIVCPNGEKGEDPYAGNNFTFESASLVVDVTRQVKDALNVSRTYIGGHSQGGFVTYSAAMQYPDLYDGAFPMAGDCWMQNEPNLWEDDPPMLQKQRRIAIAVIHGRSDPVVSFSQGEHAYHVFLAMGYPKLRLLAPEKLGHEFMLSPVPEALEWLDAMVDSNPATGLPLCARWLAEGEYGWAAETARTLLARDKIPASVRKRAITVLERVERAATAATKKMIETMNSASPEKWVMEFLEFRRQFGRTDAASSLVKKYDDRRAKQRETAKRLFSEANAQFRDKNKERGREVLREILEKAPATYEAHYAVKWLREE